MKSHRRTPPFTAAPLPRCPMGIRGTKSGHEEKYVLRLYVAGASERSRQAILRVRRLCEADLKGACELKVIDIYQQPILARDGQIVATPTLVKEFPLPVGRFIGNLTNTQRLFVALDLAPKVKTAR